jgi:hypothetical protein
MWLTCCLVTRSNAPLYKTGTSRALVGPVLYKTGATNANGGAGGETCGFLRGYTEGSGATYCGVAGWSQGVIACSILGAAKQKTVSRGPQHVV